MAKRNLEGLSITEIHKELKRRERMTARHVKKLMGRRVKLREQLAGLDAEITAFGGRIAGAGGRKRPKNAFKLADALVKVLRSTTMSVTDVAVAVQEAGYQTTSPNFRTIVNQTLLKDSRFKRVSRGQYTSKG